MDLKGLLGLRRGDELPGDDEGRAHVLGGDLLEVIDFPLLKDHLDPLEGGAVVQVNEPQGFGIPNGAGPAADGDGLPGIGGKVFIK